MTASREVVLRLMPGPDLEGIWVIVPERSHAVVCRPDGCWVTLVATGSVEWSEDRCAEVYVPADRLALWRAEHDVG